MHLWPSSMASFAPFTARIKDPDWIAARTAPEVNGPIVAKAHSVFMDPTHFPALK